MRVRGRRDNVVMNGSRQNETTDTAAMRLGETSILRLRVTFVNSYRSVIRHRHWRPVTLLKAELDCERNGVLEFVILSQRRVKGNDCIFAG